MTEENEETCELRCSEEILVENNDTQLNTIPSKAELQNVIPMHKVNSSIDLTNFLGSPNSTISMDMKSDRIDEKVHLN